ncbi:MAG: hypothetical protein A2145_03420 [candidate division Zixibacteria bacterium RBG_16_40_9]|nr:MAG: hypothetical protein A2145_03420 [candidate division Zixibacteria bacterium RBG_16_40_9]
MLNDVLYQLKSVPGVSGVLVLDKTKNNTYQLLPASFSQMAIKNLAMRLSELTRDWSESQKIELKFDNGLAWVINLEKVAVLILARRDLSLPDLNLVLKSALLSIEKKLHKETPDFVPSELTREAPFKKGIENHILVSAFNQVASKYREALGSFAVTKNLRKSKDKILPQYLFLNNFFVDNYGAVSLLAGHITATDYQLLEGMAYWLKGFKTLCDASAETVLRETSLRELTSPYKMDLENSGFYNILDQVVYS